MAVSKQEKEHGGAARHVLCHFGQGQTHDVSARILRGKCNMNLKALPEHKKCHQFLNIN